MQTAKEKISNMASAAKEHMTICKAKMEEKVEKSAASTKEEKEMANERRKAKEAQAKMELHQAKAKHAAEKLNAKRRHHVPGLHHHAPPVTTQYGTGYTEPAIGTQSVETGVPVAQYGTGYTEPAIGTQSVETGVPVAGATAPTHHPLGGHPHGRKFI